MADNKPIIDDAHEKRWYVVNTYAGHENRVKENLEKRVESMGIQDSLFRIVVAEEPEIEIKNGKQVEKMHNMFPGYVFGVTGFIGSSGGGAKPFPVSPDEMESILRRMGQSDKKVSVEFKVGDTVRILTGPFSGMEGRISSMNDQTQIASVLTMLFGRETPTDINYNDLQKIED